MGIKYKYDAFISYRHVSPDKEIAEKLQKKLENYNPPKALRSMKKRGGWRIFRDETELPTSSNLSNDIKAALEESQFLIVICSKTTKDSRWCMEEIDYFKELHKGNNANIITLVADGNPEDVFPASLCNELIPVTDESGKTTYQNHIIEPLAANVSGKTLKESLKKLNTEFLRMAAPILGCGYDNLYNREHKKKIRRIFTFGSIVIALLLLFGIYNSAMLWEINNQKVALAAANEDLQKKTEELNQSNQNLQQSNKELAEKTKEAEDNLAEANKQKQAAEANLAEAERQRRIAEQNLAEANRQKKIAEDNLAEANRQQAIAEANAQEANTQRGIAEENMRIAQESEAAANEANKNLRAKTSEILANQAQIYLDDDNITAAVKTALEALSLSEENTSSNAVAENALINATGAYNHAERMLCKVVNLSGYVEFLEFSADGTHILAADSNNIIYVIDYSVGNVIKTYAPLETFGDTSEYALDDICVDGNVGYVLCNEQILAINLSDGSTKWHHNIVYDNYNYAEKIITNKNSGHIVLSGGAYPIAISKQSGKVCSSYSSDQNFSYGGWNDYTYMSSEGTLYIADVAAKEMIICDVLNSTQKKYTLDIPDDCKTLSIGESEDDIYINILTKDNYEKEDDGKLICLKKTDMTVKWETSYVGDYLASYNLNKIFEFTRRKQNNNGEYYTATEIAVVSGLNVLTFDKNNGQICFRTAEEYEDEIIYCEPNERNSIRIANSKMFAMQTFLANADGNLFKEDSLWLVDKNYYFDKKRKYVAYGESNKFALASENSSEISLYYNHEDSNYTLLSEIPEIEYLTFDKCVDNGEGVFAGYYSIYKEERKDYIIIYDVNNNRLLTHRQLSSNVDLMSFVETDTLFMVNRDGYATAMNLDGTVKVSGALHPLICNALGIPENTYISTVARYLYPTKNGVLYCISNGIYEIKVSDNAFTVNKILYNGNLGDYCMSKDFISFTKEDYKNDNCKIIYFKNGDSKISYVQDGAADATFKRGSISSVINNSNYEIAFISKEGYIGFYRYGDEKINKILLPQGEVAPLKILFSPDSKYIIAMCSNGDFIKYSIETLKEVDRYKSTLVIDSYSEFEFIDESTFMAKKYKNSTDIILVDINTMDLKTGIKDFVYLMSEDKKILFSMYVDGKKVLGYYNYLSKDELVEYANDFLTKVGN